VIVSL